MSAYDEPSSIFQLQGAPYSLYATFKSPLRTTRHPLGALSLHSSCIKQTQHSGDSPSAKHASQGDKVEALDHLRKASGWYIHPEKSYIAKALQFGSFNDAWSVMTALALYSSRVNHVSDKGTCSLNIPDMPKLASKHSTSKWTFPRSGLNKLTPS